MSARNSEIFPTKCRDLPKLKWDLNLFTGCADYKTTPKNPNCRGLEATQIVVEIGKGIHWLHLNLWNCNWVNTRHALHWQPNILLFSWGLTEQVNNNQPNSWHPVVCFKPAEILFIQLLRDQVFVTARNEGTTTCGIHASAFLWANSLGYNLRKPCRNIAAKTNSAAETKPARHSFEGEANISWHVSSPRPSNLASSMLHWTYTL